jgi:hypothetical protein
VIVSKSKNFIYVHIEKTGGTSIEAALSPYLSENDLVIGGTDFKIQNKDSLWKHSNIEDIEKYIGPTHSNMYKFTTVRDPKEIMISFYFYIKTNIFHLLPNKITKVFYDKSFVDEIKVDGSHVYTDDLRSLYFIESEIDGTGIDGFIYKMINNNLLEVSPQLNKINTDVEVFDISNIKENWQYVLNKLNIDSSISLNVINKSNRPNKIFLNSDTLKIIHDHFSVDYAIIPSLTNIKWT